MYLTQQIQYKSRGEHWKKKYHDVRGYCHYLIKSEMVSNHPGPTNRSDRSVQLSFPVYSESQASQRISFDSCFRIRSQRRRPLVRDLVGDVLSGRLLEETTGPVCYVNTGLDLVCGHVTWRWMFSMLTCRSGWKRKWLARLLLKKCMTKGGRRGVFFFFLSGTYDLLVCAAELVGVLTLLLLEEVDTFGVES
jgi:hypothetical protein